MTAVHLLTTDESGFDLASPSRDIEIAAVIVPYNRLKQQKVEAVRRRAAAMNIPAAVQERGAPLPHDIPAARAAISWLYSQILPPADLDRYPDGLLNMHGGRLPQYRGANVLQWAIINGESQLWVTWHQIVAELDAGPIWAEEAIDIPANWTALEARRAMIATGQELFPAAWNRLRSGSPPLRTPNPDEGAIWPQRRPTDGRVQPGWNERRLRDLVRALCSPWPSPTILTPAGERVIAAVSDSPGDDRLPYACADGPTVYLVLGKP